MKKFYKVTLILILLLFLTTYNPSSLNIFPKDNDLLFKIQNIEVTNNKIINKDNIIKKLNNILGQNIFFVKKEDIFKPLEAIDFLEKIEVKRKYPSTIIIKIFETKPVAILFKNSEKYLIDSSSNLVVFKNTSFNRNFPTVFGDGADKNFINFFRILKDNDFPTRKIKNYFHFQIGRWDLQLLNNQIIKLPSKKAFEAVQKVVGLLKNKDFDNYNIIDLRIHGKIVVE